MRWFVCLWVGLGALLVVAPVNAEDAIESQSGPVQQTEQPILLRPLPVYQGGEPPISFTISGSGETVILPAGRPMKPGSGQQIHRSSLFSEQTTNHLKQAIIAYRAKKLLETEHHLMAVVKLNPKVAGTHALLGEFYIGTKQYSKALKAYQGALALKPQQTVFLDQTALLIYSQLKPSSNIVALQAFAKQHPHHALSYHLLGLAYQAADDPVNSLEAFQQAVALAPNQTDSVYNLAGMYEYLGWYDKAIAQYQTVLQQQPAAPDAKVALLRVQTHLATLKTTGY